MQAKMKLLLHRLKKLLFLFIKSIANIFAFLFLFHVVFVKSIANIFAFLFLF